ncbi:MMPL family transporter [Thermomonospora cellulosilytica]|uniref:RND superfamily putative drug exporter n=1 Tax=Thermomonospora cellulosilytica TaxID=1411118 RepID=A0A7W3MU14_9ACTN|nr:MMPL family transporter [Thermomonospora cellulosilytica]MBA9001822.1 RND superfamily putative drug exporter [Thermomonospora cellulosilytica]
MLAGLGRLIHRRRWTSLVLIVLLTVLAGAWGLGVLDRFKQGGFEDPDADSTLVAKLGATYFGSTNPDVLVLYRSDTMTVDDPRYMAAVVTTVARLPKRHVAEIHSYWAFEGAGAAAFTSRDRRATFVSIKLNARDDEAKLKAFEQVRERLRAPGLDTRVGGSVPFGVEFSELAVHDIVRAEIISMPVLLILLVIVFGAVASSTLPLVVAVFSITGGLAVLHAVTYVTDVTAMALEVVTMMGVGLAIDYSLFIVNRFREELARDGDRERALVVTMVTAGRTIAVSGITVTAALSGLLLFPQMFLRTLGLAGMATVLVAVFGAVVLLPTLLAILGPRVEWGTVRRRGHVRNADSGFWYRLGHSVMRRPLPYFALTLATLAVLFGPFLNVQFTSVDARVLPETSQTRQVVETVKREFPNGSAEPIDVVVSGDLIPRNWRPAAGGDNIPPYLESFRMRLQNLPHVVKAEYTGYSQDYGGVRISVTHDQEPMSRTAQSLVRTIRGMELSKDGFPLHVDVGGSTAAQLDLMTSLMRTLPWMALLVGTLTFALLFMFFGSVVLPLKAIAMNVLSIGASFGVIVWGFQYGHLAGLLDFTPTGGVEATSMILILAVVFGLSMDYEVFLLSRIREEWDRTGDNRAAVAIGMQRTGGIITSAALLFLVVIGAFGLASITVVKLIGVGMFVAVVVDAVLVRSLLVPATMRFMGAANWWLPRPLAALHAKVDLREHDPLYDEDDDPVPPAPPPLPPHLRRPRRPTAPAMPAPTPAPPGWAGVSFSSSGLVPPPSTGPGSTRVPPTGHSAPPPPAGRHARSPVPPPGDAAAQPRGRHARRPAGSSPGTPSPEPPARGPMPPSPTRGRGTEPPHAHGAPSQNGTGAPWRPWENGPTQPRPDTAPRPRRRIVPNPDGPGWRWADDE